MSLGCSAWASKTQPKLPHLLPNSTPVAPHVRATRESRRAGTEPQKVHFVKGFHRGIELFGQHVLESPETAGKVVGLGLIIVEGPNDVIRLDTLGVSAVALCSNAIMREQAAKLHSSLAASPVVS